MNRGPGWLLVPLGLLLAAGLAWAQREELPPISGQMQFGMIPTDQVDALCQDVLEKVDFSLAQGLPGPVTGVQLWRGARADLQPKLDAAQGLQLMAAPQIMMQSGEPAEVGMSQDVQVSLPLPGIKQSEPDKPVTQVSLNVPMRVALTAWLAKDDPTGLAAVRLQAEYGMVFGHHGGELQLPVIGRMALDTVLDYSEPEVDTYLLTFAAQPGQAQIMILTTNVQPQ